MKKCTVCDSAQARHKLPGTARLCPKCFEAYQTKHVRTVPPICVAPGCTKKAAGTGLLCHCHIKRRWAQRHPLLYAYRVLCNNARRKANPAVPSFEEYQAKHSALTAPSTNQGS